MSGEPAPVALSAPQVTRYDVMGEPPFDAGGVNATSARPLNALAATIVGAPGTVAGVTVFEGAEAGPVPTELVAVTVKV